MRATGVIVRFLSLLDVALILLGLMMVILMQVQLRSDTNPEENAELTDIDFIYLYAGWKGEENGRCYLLNDRREIVRELRTDSAADIQDLLERRGGEAQRTNHVIMLLFSDDGWYSAWPAERLAEIERAWNLRVIPIYNIRLSQ